MIQKRSNGQEKSEFSIWKWVQREREQLIKDPVLMAILVGVYAFVAIAFALLLKFRADSIEIFHLPTRFYANSFSLFEVIRIVGKNSFSYFEIILGFLVDIGVLCVLHNRSVRFLSFKSIFGYAFAFLIPYFALKSVLAYLLFRLSSRSLQRFYRMVILGLNIGNVNSPPSRPGERVVALFESGFALALSLFFLISVPFVCEEVGATNRSQLCETPKLQKLVLASGTTLSGWLILESPNYFLIRAKEPLAGYFDHDVIATQVSQIVDISKFGASDEKAIAFGDCGT